MHAQEARRGKKRSTLATMFCVFVSHKRSCCQEAKACSWSTSPGCYGQGLCDLGHSCLAYFFFFSSRDSMISPHCFHCKQHCQHTHRNSSWTGFACSTGDHRGFASCSAISHHACYRTRHRHRRQTAHIYTPGHMLIRSICSRTDTTTWG
ncbi:Piso0_001067 [Millerozyma farinosa CBS 7064]|uniref:Piso0_001067 protein n=1 Tax=Pichia sorbitophila (strain ATCC MYA-4447 / BCRC 22081 / CBS 7064 / NBRC 10061 / NRRL Y-12695) TaxID=559304 RepID=G8YSA7_PICSO|nr:Piso0_001067 [Millerozyma farinosa CBS 7064]CCE79030.1 Piso0_001067 [Millerozyma farinosa CBS 7064]